MQHPDEGTIHAWLDGALGDTEAAAVAAHVDACPECAERTREARGLVAGASRIVSATDWGVGAGIGEPEAPRFVAPARRTSRRWFTPMRTAAAAVLFVAAGTALFARELNRGAFTQNSRATVAAQKLPAPVEAAPAAAPPAPASIERHAPATRQIQSAPAPAPKIAPPAASPTTVASDIHADARTEGAITAGRLAARADSSAPRVDSVAVAKKAQTNMMRTRPALSEVVVTGAIATRGAAGANEFAPKDTPRCYQLASDTAVESRLVLVAGGRVISGTGGEALTPLSWHAGVAGSVVIVIGPAPVHSLTISERGQNITAILREGSVERPVEVRRCQ